MKILQEVQKWSEKLPGWQQHGVAKLFAARKLTEQDLADMVALLKAERGIPGNLPETPLALKADQISVATVSTRPVKLLAIKNLKHVNAIVENQRIPVEPEGLTVIYGENGAGKSGYSRVLKRACRARDQREQILPDARKPKEVAGPPEAVFEILDSGIPIEISWKAIEAADKRLSTISIFDSFCATAYLDSEGDFAYTPDGLDIVEGLAKACFKIKDKLQEDIRAITVDTSPFRSLGLSQTKVGKIINALSAKTEINDILSLATLSFNDEDRFRQLTKALLVGDPKEKYYQIVATTRRISSLIDRIGEVNILIGDNKLANLKELTQQWHAAKNAADLAASRAKNQPGLLAGTGEESWRDLFEAARKFSSQFLHEHYLSQATADSQCPLCQNTLGIEGAQRLQSFDAFVQHECETRVATTKKKALSAALEFESTNLSLVVDEIFFEELTSICPEIVNKICDFDDAIAKRRDSVLKALAPEGSWESVPALPQDFRSDLDHVRLKMLSEAATLEGAIDETTRSSLLNEKEELAARYKLAEIKGLVISAVSSYKRIEALKYCIDATNTATISRKATDINSSLATKEVLEALNDELKALCVHELKVGIKTSSSGGKTFYKLVLELPGGERPADILSEGEQRAIALASFLAEARLSGERGALIFDDPVSSLDHRRRWNVAKRIAMESTSRQVIVFTHDIYFLCILQQEVKALGGAVLSQCIRRTHEGYGNPTTKLPFDALSTKQRIGALRQIHEKAASVYKQGDEDEHRRLTRDAYRDLRIAWERGVEEVLLNNTINRFSEGVSTLRLIGVMVDDSDYIAVYNGMTRCSKFAHDASSNITLPTPHPTELAADISELESWRKQAEEKRKLLEARRKVLDWARS